jgi:hypothetical protein
MSAEKTGLKKYTTVTNQAGCAYAGRIEAVAAYNKIGAPSGAKTLTFSDSPKRVNLIPEWIAQNNPAVGGYFVVEDLHGNTVCKFVDATTFSAAFTPA